MDQIAENPRAISRLAYIFLFGAIWRYAAFEHAMSDAALSNGLLYVWIIMACMGAIFIVLKDSSISNRTQKINMMLADLFITITLLILLYSVQNFLGLIKAGIIFAVEVIFPCVCIAIILGIAAFLYASFGPLDSPGRIPRFSYFLDLVSVLMFGIAWFVRKRKTE